jgi:hypothetical protein
VLLLFLSLLLFDLFRFWSLRSCSIFCITGNICCRGNRFQAISNCKSVWLGTLSIIISSSTCYSQHVQNEINQPKVTNQSNNQSSISDSWHKRFKSKKSA